MKTRRDFEKLQQFNAQVLLQVLDVIDAHRALPLELFAQYTGPHLRHIIEHYEAFVGGVGKRSVDYDTRLRESALEQSLDLAEQRVRTLQVALSNLTLESLEDPIAIHLRAGLEGEDNIVSFSSTARELLFLASHSIHHFAIIKLRGESFGLAMDENFGKAPSTVRHASGV